MRRSPDTIKLKAEELQQPTESHRKSAVHDPQILDFGGRSGPGLRIRHAQFSFNLSRV
jgi:hypothetical protein